jgi:hypothetical protein
MKRKVLKSIFTHSLFYALNDPNVKGDSAKVHAIRISARICKALKVRGKQEYIDLITNHLIKLMLEDEKDSIRKECLISLDLNLKTIPYVITRT